MFKDLSLVGLKPIAIMLEDVDESGTLQNSVPIQFTAGKFFPESLDENITLECENIPTLKNVVNLQALSAVSDPHSGRMTDTGIDIYPGGEANFEIFYEGVEVERFHFEGPNGISCNEINDETHNEKLECQWAPSLDYWHFEKTHFCFVAIGRVFIRIFFIKNIYI